MIHGHPYALVRAWHTLQAATRKLLLLLLLFALAVAYAFILAAIDVNAALHATCVTDTECARHCPPPADDPDCDGGPHS